MSLSVIMLRNVRYQGVELVAGSTQPLPDDFARQLVYEQRAKLATPDPAAAKPWLPSPQQSQALRALTAGALVRGRGVIAPRSAFHQSGFTSTGAVQYTFMAEVEHEAPFDYMRVRVPGGLGTTWVLGGLKFAAAPQAGMDGTTLSWVQGSFSSAGANSRPPALANTPTTITVPTKGAGAGGNIVTPYVWSDWAQVSSVERTDGGRGWLSQIRMLLPTSASYITVNGTDEALVYNSTPQMRKFRGQRVTGDALTTITAMTPDDNNAYYAMDLVEVCSRVAGPTVYHFGDSIDRGQGYTDPTLGRVNAGSLAVDRVSTPAAPLHYANLAISGRTTANIRTDVRDLLNNGYATAVIWPAGSPNDLAGSRDLTAQWPDTLALVLQCVAAGVTPIIRSCLPEPTLTTAEDVQRLDLNARCANLMQAIGGIYIDAAAKVTDGGMPERIQPGLTGADGKHPNQAGTVLVADAFEVAFRSLLGS